VPIFCVSPHYEMFKSEFVIWVLSVKQIVLSV
jgi:hypothetical protein